MVRIAIAFTAGSKLLADIWFEMTRPLICTIDAAERYLKSHKNARP